MASPSKIPRLTDDEEQGDDADRSKSFGEDSMEGGGNYVQLQDLSVVDEGMEARVEAHLQESESQNERLPAVYEGEVSLPWGSHCQESLEARVESHFKVIAPCVRDDEGRDHNAILINEKTEQEHSSEMGIHFQVANNFAAASGLQPHTLEESISEIRSDGDESSTFFNNSKLRDAVEKHIQEVEGNETETLDTRSSDVNERNVFGDINHQDLNLSLKYEVEPYSVQEWQGQGDGSKGASPGSHRRCSTPNCVSPQNFFTFSPIAADSQISSTKSIQDISVADDISSSSSDRSITELDMCQATDSEEDDSQHELILPDKKCNENIFNVAKRLNDVKLFPGSEQSVNDAILNVMQLHVKNHESKAGLKRLVRTVCNMLPKGHNLPPSSFRILTYIESLAPDIKETVHYFCKSCFVYREYIAGDCKICRITTESGKFFHFDIADVVKYWFECRNLGLVMDSLPVNESETLKDIQDGSVYKALNVDRNKYDVNLVLSTDGVRIRKSSHKELWVLMGTLVEVPVHLREAFITVLGVWYSDIKPTNMNAFFKPFADKMRTIELESNGVDWKCPNSGEVNRSQVKAPLMVADAPARAKVQNIVNFNGKNGCNMCEIESVQTAPIPNKKRIRVFKFSDNLTLRNKDTMIEQSREATELNLHVKGVKGPSALSLIPSFDIATCVIPEYMHCVLLGVMKHLLTIWTEKAGRWNISHRIPDIDTSLKTIRHPDFVHRLSRTLKTLAYWKASDYYYFMFFESLPVLKDHLPEAYFQHFILLVRSVYHLLKRSIAREEVNEADTLLNGFVQQFEHLYGERTLTYNIHQLCHLGLCVKRFGPLSCNNAFPFESMNGTIAKATHGTNFVSEEIMTNIKICQGVEMLKRVCNGLDVGCSYKSKSVPRGEVCGKVQQFCPSPEETELFEGCEIEVYAKAKIGFDIFTSEIYKTLKTADFYVMLQCNGVTEYGSIKYFAKSGERFFVCLRMFSVDHLNVIYNSSTLKSVTHLIPVKTTEKCIVVSDDNILSSFVKVGKAKNFIFVRPNKFHSVL